MNITKLVLRKIKKKENHMENYFKIYKCKNNDVTVNSLLIGEAITTNAKLIADHSNTFFYKCCC